MRGLGFVASYLWFLADVSYAIGLPKRADGFTCSSPPTSILCPSLKTVNANGLNVLEALYFGMQNASLPDSTTYNAGENIICVTHSSGPTIDLSGNIGASADGVSAGLGICIFPEGDPQTNASDPITLGQVKPLVDYMINHGCKVCGEIPIHFLDRNVTNAIGNGGLLKVDYKTNDNCIDKCIGPWSYKGNLNSNSNSTATAATTSATKTSAARRLAVPSLFNGGIAEWFLHGAMAHPT
ncbi:hypothetical protein V8E54_009040 [Elaphomyces granulatus]